MFEYVKTAFKNHASAHHLFPSFKIIYSYNQPHWSRKPNRCIFILVLTQQFSWHLRGVSQNPFHQCSNAKSCCGALLVVPHWSSQVNVQPLNLFINKLHNNKFVSEIPLPYVYKGTTSRSKTIKKQALQIFKMQQTFCSISLLNWMVFHSIVGQFRVSRTLSIIQPTSCATLYQEVAVACYDLGLSL